MAWTLYELIGLPQTATSSEIAARCRRLLVLTHPDRAGDAARGLFGIVAHAEETLTDPAKRAAYDERLRQRQRQQQQQPQSPSQQPLGSVVLDRITADALDRIERWLGKGGAA